MSNGQETKIEKELGELQLEKIGEWNGYNNIWSYRRISTF
jgi:hypothetical protein